MKKRLAAMIILILGIALLLFCVYGWECRNDVPGGGRSVRSPGGMGGASEEEGRIAAEAQRTVTGGAQRTATGETQRTVTGEPPEEKKKIALTFDDGPHPYYTEQLLDGLKERGVKATFFVIGENASLHEDVIRRMYEEGHLIGNHTYSHIQLTSSNQEAFREELKRTNQVIREITGQEVLYVRPPYGSWNREFEKELNMIPVLWTIDPLDWCSDDVACITQRVVSEAGEDEIILLHDYYETSVTAALCIVDQLLEEGYEFVTVEELLFD